MPGAQEIVWQLSQMEELSKKWHQKDATSLVVKLGKSSQWTEVLQLVALAREPDSIFLSAAISACGQARRWKAALAVFRCGKKDVLTCDAAMSVCEKSNQWQHVMQLFDEMTSTNIQKSLRTFTTTIKACKMWTAAIEYLQQLRQSSLQPDILLYTVLLNTIASDSKWEVAVATLDDMTRNALRADSFIYGAVIKSCDAGVISRVFKGYRGTSVFGWRKSAHLRLHSLTFVSLERFPCYA